MYPAFFRSKFLINKQSETASYSNVTNAVSSNKAEILHIHSVVFNLLHLNVQSLSIKRKYLWPFSDRNNVDFFTVCEDWLMSDNVNCCHINNYKKISCFIRNIWWLLYIRKRKYTQWVMSFRWYNAFFRRISLCSALYCIY